MHLCFVNHRARTCPNTKSSNTLASVRDGVVDGRSGSDATANSVQLNIFRGGEDGAIDALAEPLPPLPLLSGPHATEPASPDVVTGAKYLWE
jgi:hypothetical protein